MILNSIESPTIFTSSKKKKEEIIQREKKRIRWLWIKKDQDEWKKEHEASSYIKNTHTFNRNCVTKLHFSNDNY